MSPHEEAIVDPGQPALVVTYGHTARKYRPLQRDLVVIGQGRGSDIGVVGPEVADAHCVLFRTPDGWRVRDCGTRIGTRLNGKSVVESVLCDGDVLQVGTFNFRFHLPAAVPAAAAGARERRLQRSRRHLARLALALRRRLRREQAAAVAAGSSQAEVDQHLGFLRERLRQYEVRAQQLQQAERELTAERGRLEAEAAAQRLHAEQSERVLAQRRSAVEADLRRRRAECEERCRDLERRAATAPPPGPACRAASGAEVPPGRRDLPATDPEEARRLELRRRELECYARHLQRLRQSAPADGALAAERDELRKALAAARREVEEKETQVQRLLTERQVVDAAAEGMDVESYEAQLAAFRRQLQDDRRGVNEEIRLLRERTLALDQAARAMEQQLAQERARLEQERAELERLRAEVSPEPRPTPSGSRPRMTVAHPLQKTMAAPPGRQPEAGGSNGRGQRLRAPRRGNGSGSAGR
jgi:hypothetical protein